MLYYNQKISHHQNNMNTHKVAYIMSGNCRMGDVGEPTPLKDCMDKNLFVGDIVIVSIIDQFGINSNAGLSVVCSDKYISYIDGTHEIKTDEITYFIMGIKNVDFMNVNNKTWLVKRIKSFEDVIVGEHWKDYGFNYV